MAYELTWMPSVLLAAGLKVAELPGWIDRGLGSMARAKGVMIHHTATRNPNKLNLPTRNWLMAGGRQASGQLVPGPVANIGVGLDGTFYMVAAGRANHAGKGRWATIPDDAGNPYFIGIEAENSGAPGDIWPDVQKDALARGTAALLRRLGSGRQWAIGHKEWAASRVAHKKFDPSFDMEQFRAQVGAALDGTLAARPLIPAVSSDGLPTIRRGSRGDAVKRMQEILGVSPADGVFGPMSEGAVRRWQRDKGLVADGIIGPKSWVLLIPAT